MRSSVPARLIPVLCGVAAAISFVALLAHDRDTGMLVGCVVLSAMTFWNACRMRSGRAYVRVFGFGENAPWLNRLGTFVFAGLGAAFAILAACKIVDMF